MCERMFESVFELRIEAGFIQELRGLKSSEPLAKLFLRLIRDGLEKRERYILSNNGRRLKKTLLLRRKSVNPRG